MSRSRPAGTLVLSHFVPSEDDELTGEARSAAAAATFRGRIVVGKDLLEV